MPIAFRLRRDHLGANYLSETNFVAISGQMEIGREPTRSAIRPRDSAGP
jgi:hypothetical protein